jgi:hypothetical protein
MGEEPLNHHHHPHHQQQQQHLTATAQRSLTRAASLRGAAGAPAGTSGTPPPQTRFFTEKKVSHESLVVGALENAFKDMVSGRRWVGGGGGCRRQRGCGGAQKAHAVDGRTVSFANTHAHREYEAGCSTTLVTKASPDSCFKAQTYY